MRRILLVAVLAAAVGCTRYQGPREVRQNGRADLPGYTIDEQEKRGRARYAIPTDDFRVGPQTGVSSPDPTGRTGGGYPGRP